MKKKLLIMAFTGLSGTMAFAADLYVRNGEPVALILP